MTAAPPIADEDTLTRQSLAHGPLGIALLRIEQAHRGTGPWQAVHSQLAAIGPLIDNSDTNLFLGAPAMAYTLHLAATDSDRYANALHTLDAIVAAHTRRRLSAAHTRIDQGKPTSFAEYDLLRGLTGLGAVLLRRAPGSNEMKGVLDYLVRLTEPLPGPDGQTRPGWWVWHAPIHLGTPTPGGHANAGLAHGITGPLAVLALAKRHGIAVHGHDDAMVRICRWLDLIRRTDHYGTHWPRWVATTTTMPTNPAAPSWCYGTPGQARAQQLAAIALNDPNHKRMAERALLHGLADPHQLDRLTNRGLCHGVGGLIRVVQRVAQDAENPYLFTDHLAPLIQRLLGISPSAELGV